MRCLVSIFAVLVLFTFVHAQSRTYTLDADFEEGTLVGVEHETDLLKNTSFCPLFGFQIVMALFQKLILKQGKSWGVIVSHHIQNELSNLTSKDYALYQNDPNPFNPETAIRFQIPATTYVVLTIYNTLGEEIRRIVDRQCETGYHTVIWDSRDISGNAVTAGMYIYRIQAGEFVSMKKMTPIR